MPVERSSEPFLEGGDPFIDVVELLDVIHGDQDVKPVSNDINSVRPRPPLMPSEKAFPWHRMIIELLALPVFARPVTTKARFSLERFVVTEEVFP